MLPMKHNQNFHRYFLTPGCAEGFKALNPAIKIVIVVRDPFLRLLSDYHHEERIAEKFGRTPEEGWWSFEEMVLTPKGEVGYHVILSATQCWKITVCRINTALSSNFAHEVTRFFFKNCLCTGQRHELHHLSQPVHPSH